jgi:hypothetical protein
MKNIICGLFLIVTSLVSATELPDEISSALKKGDAVIIANYFDNSVHLSISRNEGVFSKIQAKLILKTFFEENPSSNFKEVHNGESKNNSHYSIGNLYTSSNVFRIYILFKKIEHKITILELKIELDE